MPDGVKDDTKPGDAKVTDRGAAAGGDAKGGDAAAAEPPAESERSRGAATASQISANLAKQHDGIGSAELAQEGDASTRTNTNAQAERTAATTVWDGIFSPTGTSQDKAELVGLDLGGLEGQQKKPVGAARETELGEPVGRQRAQSPWRRRRARSPWR